MSDYLEGIPTVDLNLFLNGTDSEKNEFVNQLGKAYEDIGFVAVKNHLISDVEIGALYTEVKNFFSLSQEVKTSYEIEGLAGQRGYISFGREHAKDSSAECMFKD